MWREHLWLKHVSPKHVSPKHVSPKHVWCGTLLSPALEVDGMPHSFRVLCDKVGAGPITAADSPADTRIGTGKGTTSQTGEKLAHACSTVEERPFRAAKAIPDQ